MTAWVFAALVAVAGCGGDDDSASTAPTVTQKTETTPVVTTPTETQTETESTPTETAPATASETSPENAPGGAGDEEPARTPALFTARNGQIRPRLVRVPAFISIEVRLSSADGGDYALRFGSVTVRAGEGHNFDGLRPGETMVGRPTGQGNPVTISATAEPGP